MTLSSLHVFTLGAGWLALGVVLLVRRRFHRKTVQKLDRRSLLGMALQGVGLAVVFSAQREVVSLPINYVRWKDVMALLVGTLILAYSVWMVQSALSTLGKQWSLTARVLEEHSLMASGPYRLVRHPNYCGVVSMQLGSGILVSRWESVVVGAAFFLCETVIRIRIVDRSARAFYLDI